MERRDGKIDPSELQLARTIGQLESAKKANASMEEQGESMQQLVDLLSANSQLIDVFVGQKANN